MVVVWRWQDPFTALYTHWQQQQAAPQLDHEFADLQAGRIRWHGHTAERGAVSAEAARFRREARPGEAIGRIVIGRLGLNMVLVNGTDEGRLKKGPGRDLSHVHAGTGPPRLHRRPPDDVPRAVLAHRRNAWFNNQLNSKCHLVDDHLVVVVVDDRMKTTT